MQLKQHPFAFQDQAGYQSFQTKLDTHRSKSNTTLDKGIDASSYCQYPSYLAHTPNMATDEGQEEVECVEETTTFTSVLDCVFVGDADKLTEAELNMTMIGVAQVYNDMIPTSVCDQLFRTITSVGIPEFLEGETVADASKGELELRYEVTGSCRGCPEPVLFEDSINRDPTSGRELLGPNAKYNHANTLSFLDDRELQVRSCTCPADSELRGPEQSDFINGYNRWIETKRKEGEITNLRELLSLTETGSFTAESQGPSSNGARVDTPFGLSSAYLAVLTYSFLVMAFTSLQK